MSEFNKKRRADARMKQLEKENEAFWAFFGSIFFTFIFVCLWWCL